MCEENKKESKQQKEVILLNKPFLGNWLDNAGNIGHEIIDFLRTDKGELYIYNNPYGKCPNYKIGVNDSTKKYNAKYLVLTSKENAKDKSFEILYVVELEELLHRQNSIIHKDKKKQNEQDRENLRERQKIVRNIIDERKIAYNGKNLYEIWKNDDTLYVTFKASKIYRAVNPISVKMSEYNFQRNKGCLYEDSKDFDHLKKIIEDGIKDDKILAEFQPRQIDKGTIETLNAENTFIDLIMQENNEQIFTNLLFSILGDGGLFNLFCEKFKGINHFQSDDKFKIFRENSIVQGRMDICAESDRQKIIIENKINSGLNGLKPKDNESQLSTYYNWAKEDKSIKPLCFVVVPDSRKTELSNEIRIKDPKMKTIYTIVTYKQISEFLEANKDKIKNYQYEKYIDDIVLAFSNLSKLTKEDLYARMFVEETLK